MRRRLLYCRAKSVRKRKHGKVRFCFGCCRGWLGVSAGRLSGIQWKDPYTSIRNFLFLVLPLLSSFAPPFYVLHALFTGGCLCPSHNALCLQVSAANEASPPQWLPEVPSAYNQFVYLGYTVPHSIPSRPNQRPISVESFRAQHPSRANQPRALRSDSIQALDTA